MKIAVYQYDIAWGEPAVNLRKVADELENGSAQGADLLVLPEMFSTGFCIFPEKVAEATNGDTMQVVKQLSKQYNIAICGSFVATEDGKYYNRGFFVLPDGMAHFYDKKHLFSIGQEGENYTAGSQRNIISYKGWNICMLICYDLRFPIWARNVNNEYDLLVYCANWPTARITAWDVLLQARAIENEAYVCGCNRTGVDGMGFDHIGHSAVYDYKGTAVLGFAPNEVAVKVIELNKEGLERFRSKFPAYKDADAFEMK